MSAQMSQGAVATAGPGTGAGAATAEHVAAAFGWSAAIVIVFNTALAWVKDSYDPLNTFMAQLTSHHWITHGLADVILFFLLGWLLMRRHTAAGLTNALIVSLAVAAVVAGVGLAGWFLLA
jgi:hypothetical protein